MELSFVLYRSLTKGRIAERTIVDILSKSVKNNPREGLTGFLHCDGTVFLQYLEGPKGPLARKIVQIQKDRRHRSFKILAEGRIDDRFFPDWEMGRISSDHMPSHGLLAKKSWLRPSLDVDPLELIEAFVAHAGHLDGVSIEPLR